MVQKGQQFLWPGANDNSEYGIEEVGSGEPEEGFGSKLGDGRVKLSGTPPGLHDEMLPGNVIETDTLRNEIDPTAINRRRSDKARQMDKALDAKTTDDPLKWASAPDEYDLAGRDF